MRLRIINYELQYRDDMIFCIMSAKDALGRIPKLNDDLLDIQGSYIKKGDIFLLAVDENERVYGTCGTMTTSDTEMWLRRLYVKPQYKRQKIGMRLYLQIEKFARSRKIKILHTRFSDDYYAAPYFYTSMGFIETERDEGMRHFIKIIN